MKAIGFGILALVLVGMVATGVAAFGGAMKDGMRGEGLEGRMGQDEEIKAAIEADDYSLLPEDSTITVEQFDMMVDHYEYRQDMQEAVEADDYSMVPTISEEQFNRMVDRHEVREAVDAAIEANDYEAWQEAIADTPRGEQFLDAISEDDFGTLVEMHEARTEGDHETARTLAEELGLDRGHMNGHGKGGFGKGGRMHKGMGAIIN